MVHHVQPLSTQQCLRVLHAARHASNATSGLNCFHPLPLFWAQAAGLALDLNAGEHRHLLADHFGRDGDRAPAD